MTSPKHLWSGDWQEDSAAAAEELARRRGQTDQNPPPPPESDPEPAARRTPALARLLAALDGRRLSRAGLVFVVSALAVAGVAIGLSKALSADASRRPAGSASGTAWLGVQMESLPVGVTITTVVPGSPADNAGLEPGDVLTQVNNRSVSTAADVTAALGGLPAGDQVELQVQRGPLTYTTQAVLAVRPQGSP